MGLGNICLRCVLRTAIGIMMQALSPLKNNAMTASLSSWERVFFKNRIEKAKFWLVLLTILFGLLVHVPYVQGMPTELAGTTLDFETGDLRGWTKNYGTAFDNQPTFGDNPTARNRGQPSNHQGNYWIGTYENYQGLPGQNPGDFQGDGPAGSIQSPDFTIPSGTLSFLIGGGSSFDTRVELFVRDPIEGRIRKLYTTGKDTETMERVTWNLTSFAGKTGGLLIVDDSTGPWGHINVDDFIFQSTIAEIGGVIGNLIDKVLPTVHIYTPSNGQIFTTNVISVDGTADDNVGVSRVEVRVDNEPWQLAQLASGTTLWSTSATLSPGSNTIYARATDTSGNIKETSVFVTYNPATLPTISITSPTTGQTFTTSTVTVSGTASGNALSKVEVKLGAAGTWQLALGTTSWSTPITMSPGSNTIYARATDISGNAAEPSMIILNLAQAAAAGEWPMFGHDPSHTGVADEIVEPPLDLLWKYTTENLVSSSPAVSRGVVYVGSWDGNLYALDAATGNLKWKYTTGGFDSSPAVSDDVVYVFPGDLYALDAAIGNLKWKYITGHIVRSSPTIFNSVVYVGSYNIYAFDAATGNLKWKYNTEYLNARFASSSPAVSGGVVYVGSQDNNVYALDAATGNLKWKYATGDIIFSSPAVSDGVVYVGSQDNNVYALDATTGNLKWKYATGDAIHSSPAVSGSVVYVGSWDGNLYALDASTGNLKWKYTTGGRVESSPAVSGSVVYVGLYDGLYAFDAITGNLKWKYTTGDAVSSPAISGGVVYVGSADNNVYAFASRKSPPPPPPLPPEATALAVAIGTTLIIGSAATMSGNSVLNRLSNYWKKLEEIVREFLKIGSKFSYEELERKIISGIFKEEKEAKEIKVKGEYKELLIAGGAIFFAFALELYPYHPKIEYEVSPIIFLLSIAFFAMVAEIGHDLAIRFSLKSVGGKSVFELSLIGTIITIVSGFFGFVIAAAGGTRILYTFKNSRTDAIVASSGSLFNLILGIFLLFISLYFNIEWLTLSGALPNLAYATFCLFPIYPFEGRRVFKGSKGIWRLLFFSSMFLYTCVILIF